MGNLYVTAILHETRPMVECAPLTFAAALALIDAVRVPQAGLKWPNDLLINGSKAAGVLLEVGGKPESPWVLIGIGVNFNSHPSDLTYSATDLLAHGYKEDLGTLCHDLLAGLDHWRGIWHRQGAVALYDAWTARAIHQPGQTLKVGIGENVMVGQYQGLDRDGALILIDNGGNTHHITAGDVFFS